MVFKKDIGIFVLLGLVLGIFLDKLTLSPNVHLFYLSVVSLSFLLYALSYNEENSIRLIGSSFIVALFLSFPLITIDISRLLPDPMRVFSFLAAFPLFAYIGHCFHYAYHHDNTWKVSYRTLFAAVWNTILLVIVALIFSVIAQLLILLAAFIFKTVGNFYLWNLYFHSLHFNFICEVTLFFIGIGLGQQNLELIYNLRFLLLKMMYILFPFLALISCIYFVLYWIHSISAQPEYINSILVLTPLTILGILFFNAYFQDGTTNKEIPSWFKNSLKVYRVVLFLLTILLFFKISKTTQLNTNHFICLFLVILFTLTYALTVCLPEHEEVFWIRIGNIGTALFFVIALFLVNFPFLSGNSNPSFKIEKQLKIESHISGTTKTPQAYPSSRP